MKPIVPVADRVAGYVARYGNSDALGYPVTWCHTNAELDRFEQLINQGE